MAAHQLMDIASTARELRAYGITRKWLRQEAEAQQIPCLNTGRKLLFSPAAVERELLRRAGAADATLTYTGGAQQPSGGNGLPTFATDPVPAMA